MAQQDKQKSNVFRRMFGRRKQSGEVDYSSATAQTDDITGATRFPPLEQQLLSTARLPGPHDQRSSSTTARPYPAYSTIHHKSYPLPPPEIISRPSTAPALAKNAAQPEAYTTDRRTPAFPSSKYEVHGQRSYQEPRNGPSSVAGGIRVMSSTVHSSPTPHPYPNPYPPRNNNQPQQRIPRRPGPQSTYVPRPLHRAGQDGRVQQRVSIIEAPQEVIPTSRVARTASMRVSRRSVFNVMNQQDAISPTSINGSQSPEPLDRPSLNASVHNQSFGQGSSSKTSKNEFESDSDVDDDQGDGHVSDESSTDGPNTGAKQSLENSPIDNTIFLHDYNSRFEGLKEPPAWYIGQPTVWPADNPRSQCGTCRRINISYLYNQPATDNLARPNEYIRLGSLADILAKFQKCGLCHFFMRLIALEVATQRLGLKFTTSQMAAEFFGSYLNDMDNLMMQYSIYPIQFKEYYRIRGLFLCRGPPPDPPVPGSKAAKEAKRPSYLLGFREIHSCCQAPGTGRYVLARTVLDFEWIKNEMKICEERSVGRPKRLPVKIRVIDVHRLCIVDREPEDDYVALSYVWGNAKQVRLIWATQDILYEPGGLSRFWKRLPATIQDAILLTQKIEQQYLWVDALCIFQDDPEDQQRQISRMSEIYRTATLTIQARCGDDASYGLPGVQPETRHVRQILGVGGEKALCNVLPFPEEIPSAYDTRAWTLQESVFSQRKLLITDHSCEFWCGHTATNEDVHCRHKMWPVGARFKSMLYFKNNHSSYVPTGMKSTSFTFYAGVVEMYTPRRTRNPEDAEKAALGILESFKNWLGGETRYGLPDIEIEAALLWVPVGESVRRIGEREDGTRGPLFPSWSWLGWIGPVGYPWRCERSMPISTRSCPLRWRVKSRVYNDMDNDYDYEEDKSNDTGYDDGKREGDHSRFEWASNHRRFHGSSWTRDKTDPWCWTDGSSEEGYSENPRCLDSVGWNMLRSWRHPHRLGIQSLAASFHLSGHVIQRSETYGEDTICEMTILNDQNFAIGAIVVPPASEFTSEQKVAFRGGDIRHTFVVISRASIKDDPLDGLGELEDEDWADDWSSSYPLDIAKILDTPVVSSTEAGDLDPKGMFDRRVYNRVLPYCLFNVLMIERDELSSVAFRVALGRIHISAFMLASPRLQSISLE